MKIAVRSYIGADSVDGVGGGEQRYSTNLAYFLAKEGHEVYRIHQALGCDDSFDLYLDASWEDCHKIPEKVKHIHFSFSAVNEGARQFPCIDSGRCIYSNPYLIDHKEALEWSKGVPITPVFIPLPYPDFFIPSGLKPGFDRTEITWATKDPFHRNYGDNHNFVRHGFATLEAIVEFQEKVDFKFNYVLFQQLGDSTKERFDRVKSLLMRLKNFEAHKSLPWTQLLNTLGRSKLLVPVGGLCGSTNEAIYLDTLPLQVEGYGFFVPGRDITILPNVHEVNKDHILEALNTFWFDRDRYNKSMEFWQDVFKIHRSDGVRENFRLTLEKIGLA